MWPLWITGLRRYIDVLRRHSPLRNVALRRHVGHVALRRHVGHVALWRHVALRRHVALQRRVAFLTHIALLVCMARLLGIGLLQRLLMVPYRISCWILGCALLRWTLWVVVRSILFHRLPAIETAREETCSEVTGNTQSGWIEKSSFYTQSKFCSPSSILRASSVSAHS